MIVRLAADLAGDMRPAWSLILDRPNPSAMSVDTQSTVESIRKQILKFEGERTQLKEQLSQEGSSRSSTELVAQIEELDRVIAMKNALIKEYLAHPGERPASVRIIGQWPRA